MFDLSIKIKNFINKPLFFEIQSILNIIPFKPFRVSRSFMLLLDHVPDVRCSRGVRTVRMATIDDVPALCMLENKPEIYKLWFERGEHCVVAIDNNSIVGVEWFSSAKWHVEENSGYKIVIPFDSIYSFSAFIKEEYRIRGIWIQFKIFIQNWMDQQGREKIITMIDYGNNHSLKTHVRFGFTIVKDVFTIGIFGFHFFFQNEVHFDPSVLSRYLVKISNK